MQFLFTDNCFVSLHYTPCTILVPTLSLSLGVRCGQLSCNLCFQQTTMSVLCASNPDKVSGWEEDNHLPPRDFAYNFAKRNVLSIRSTMELSKARSILTVKDLEIWHKYTEDGLVVFNPKFRECFLDGSGKRILNMDESLLSLGESKTKILLFKSLNTEYRAHGSVARVSSVIFVSFDSGGQLFPFFLTYLDFV